MNLHQSIMKLASAFCAGALLLSGLALNPAIAKQEPLSLARQGAWNVNYDDDSCHLIRSFGTGRNEIIMSLTRYQPEDRIGLTLFGTGLASSYAHSLIKLGFVSSSPPRHHETINGNSGKLPMAIVLDVGDILDRDPRKKAGILGPITPQQEASVTAMTMQFEAKTPVRLELGSMAVPLNALRTCTTDLVKFWGLDPDVQARLTRPAMPIGSPSNWLKTSDYPDALYSVGKEGLVRFRLEVDEKGAVTACHIQLKMKSEEFNKLSCDLVKKRAHFDPALDSAGRPVKSFHVNTVRWILAD